VWLYTEYTHYSFEMTKDKELNILGKNIRQLRKDRGFSQEGFANFINMNRGYYGTIERGEANVTATNLLKIMRGLKTSPNDLFPLMLYEIKEK
jgi:transcriptional regulator with XRE-family HTH domain